MTVFPCVGRGVFITYIYRHLNRFFQCLLFACSHQHLPRLHLTQIYHALSAGHTRRVNKKCYQSMGLSKCDE